MINREKLAELIRNYPCMSTASADDLLVSIAEDLADDLADQASSWLSDENWVSVETMLPPEDTAVLVTYLGYKTGIPYADLFAYLHKGKWHWFDSDDIGCTDVRVPITHWRYGPVPAGADTKAPYGEVIISPCHVGQRVWFKRNKSTPPIETTVEKIVKKSTGIYLKLACNKMYETSCHSIGKTVFLEEPKKE